MTAESRHLRRGAVLAAVLICLAVCSAIIVALLSAGVRQRRQVELEQRRAQATWLAEAGIERAVARLAANPTYAGEDWQLSRDQLALSAAARARSEGNGPAAVVHIEVRLEGGGPARRIFVRADFPPEVPRRARHEHSVLWTPQPGDES